MGITHFRGSNSCFLRLSSVGLLIYASVIFHRFRKGKLTGGGAYSAAHNPGMPAQNTSYPSYGNVHDVENNYSSQSIPKPTQTGYQEGQYQQQPQQQQQQYPQAQYNQQYNTQYNGQYNSYAPQHGGEAHEMGRYN